MCGRGDARDRRREASNGGDLRASRLLCGAGKLSMAGSYKVAFLKALDEAYPGWSGEVAPTASSPSRRTDAMQASAVDVMPGEPGLPAGTARGYEPRQKPPTPSDQRSSKPEDRQERQSQTNFASRERETLHYFLRFLPRYWKKILLAILGLLFEAVLGVMRPWPLKVVIDRVLSHKPSRVPLIHQWLDAAPSTSMQILYGACAAVLLIAIATGLTVYCYTRLIGKVGQLFVYDLRRDLFAHMQRLSLRFHDTQRTGDLTTRLTSDIQSIQDFITSGVTSFCSNALLLAALAQETLASIRIVQGLAQEDQIDDRFQAQSETTLEAFLESVRYQARIAPVVDCLSAIGLTMVMWYGARCVLNGQLTTGEVIIFVAYVNNFYTPMKSISRSANTFTKASVGAARIVEVLQHRREVRDRKRARPAPKFFGAIEFRDVSFEYEPGVPILLHVNLHIAPGQKLAIVGA